MVFTKRIVLIDEDDSFLALLKYTLEQNENVRVVSLYTNCQTALKELSNDRPDLIIMDLEFMEMKGVEFIAAVKKEYFRMEFLIVTQNLNQHNVLRVLSVGACGLLSKKDALNRVNNAVSLIFKGGSPLDEYVARLLIESIQIDSNSPLSRQETNVMKLMMNGMTYTRIAKELGISKETAKVHMRNIYRKLKVNSKAEAVSKAVSEKIVSASMLY